MAEIKIIVEADTQEEVDMYCDMIYDMCNIKMYRNSTINRHFDDITWKKTTITISPYKLKEDYNFKHRNDNHKCSNCKWFDGKEHCFCAKAKGEYQYEIRINYPDHKTDCCGWELKELKGEV